jgi:hypothetical protein
LLCNEELTTLTSIVFLLFVTFTSILAIFYRCVTSGNTFNRNSNNV